MVQFTTLFRLAAILGTTLSLFGCGESGPATRASSSPPPAVTVVKVVSADVKTMSSFTGRVEAKDKVDLRARIEGFLDKRLFTEGAGVKEGDLLFVIEKGLYQAAVDEAKAGLEKAQSALKLADIEVERQSQLVQRNVAARAVLDQVTAKQGEARGAMLAQKAALEKAQLQLGYTEINAPLSGRIGRANVSVGNFVGPGSGTLATIVSQDPIYVTFPVTQREILAFRKQRTNGAKGGDTVIYAQLADGSRYDKPGKLNFVDVTVSQGTDTVQVRATFPNPDRILVDGALVTVIAEAAAGEPALLVPQQTVQVDQTGAFVLIVGKDRKVQVRRVELGPARESQIVVRKGLADGELVISEGIQKVRPGQVVAASEAKAGT